MNSPQAERLSGVVETVWDRVARPNALGVTLVALALVASLEMLPSGDRYAGVARVLAVLTVGLASMLAVRLAEGPSRWSRSFHRQAVGCGLVKVASLPFFDEELPAGRRNRLAALRARRGLFGLALAVAIVGGTPGVLVMLRDVPGAAWGETTVAVGNTAETFVMARPAAGVQRTIGLKLELTGVSRGEDGRWQADVTVRDPATDGETVVTFRAGERSRLRDHMLSLSDVLPVPGAGRVVLTLTPVQGGAAEHVSFAVGMSHELPDGTVITVSDATLSFARQLGPAVRVVERRAEEVVSDRWVFASDATFDGRHAGGAWAVSLDDVEPQLAATFSVADVMLTPMQPGVAAVIWLGLVALCLGLTIRGGVIAVGRAGDYVLVAGGVLATGNAAESTARALLDADQNGERDAVLSAVAGSGA